MRETLYSSDWRNFSKMSRADEDVEKWDTSYVAGWSVMGTIFFESLKANDLKCIRSVTRKNTIRKVKCTRDFKSVFRLQDKSGTVGRNEVKGQLTQRYPITSLPTRKLDFI